MLEICIQTSYDQNVQLILKSYLPVVHGTTLNYVYDLFIVFWNCYDRVVFYFSFYVAYSHPRDNCIYLCIMTSKNNYTYILYIHFAYSYTKQCKSESVSFLLTEIKQRLTILKKEGPSWSWSYGSWIYNHLCNQCLSLLTLWVRIPHFYLGCLDNRFVLFLFLFFLFHFLHI
jgi:hypothetical protein